MNWAAADANIHCGSMNVLAPRDTWLVSRHKLRNTSKMRNYLSFKNLTPLVLFVCLPLFAQRGGGGGRGAAGLPLATDRTMSFTTDEGTWMSLDISHDGKTIIFDLVGRLYTMPVEGGSAKSITEGLSYDHAPRYSPDGTKIVFISDRSGEDNVWIANADGTSPHAVTAEDNALFVSPSWSTDGDAIFVSKKRPHFFSSTLELWRYEVAGGSGSQVIRAAGGGGGRGGGGGGGNRSSLGAVMAPDQRHLYFARKNAGGGGGGRLTPWQIVRHDLLTGEDDALTAIEGGGFRPLLSPDGRRLIYGTRFEARTALRMRDLVTGEEKWLKYPIQRDDQESANAGDLLPGYAFFPDGKEIAFSTGGKIHRLNIETGADKVIPFEAKVTRELGPKLNFPTKVDEGPVHARLIQGTSVSPDGKQVAFSALTHVYVANKDDGNPRRPISRRGQSIHARLVTRWPVDRLFQLERRRRSYLENPRRWQCNPTAPHDRAGPYPIPRMVAGFRAHRGRANHVSSGVEPGERMGPRPDNLRARLGPHLGRQPHGGRRG